MRYCNAQDVVFVSYEVHRTQAGFVALLSTSAGLRNSTRAGSGAIKKGSKVPVLQRLVEEIGRALEHLADDGEALDGVRVEDGRWGEGVADEGEFPSEVELVRDDQLW